MKACIHNIVQSHKDFKLFEFLMEKFDERRAFLCEIVDEKK